MPLIAFYDIGTKYRLHVPTSTNFQYIFLWKRKTHKLLTNYHCITNKLLHTVKLKTVEVVWLSNTDIDRSNG